MNKFFRFPKLDREVAEIMKPIPLFRNSLLNEFLPRSYRVSRNLQQQQQIPVQQQNSSALQNQNQGQGQQQNSSALQTQPQQCQNQPTIFDEFDENFLFIFS